LRVEYREKNEMHEEQVVDLDRERDRDRQNSGRWHLWTIRPK